MTLTSPSFRPVVSREFMVRQAVLNALQDNVPHTLAYRGSAHAARWLIEQAPRLGFKEPLCHTWVSDIQRHFRLLSAQYQEAAQ